MNKIVNRKLTLSDIRDANRAAGFHFFDESSMRFFDSKVDNQVYDGKGGVYFCTSEQFHGSTKSNPRKWTVRVFDPETGDVDTARAAGKFNVLTKDEAHRRAEALSKNTDAEFDD